MLPTELHPDPGLKPINISGKWSLCHTCSKSMAPMICHQSAACHNLACEASLQLRLRHATLASWCWHYRTVPYCHSSIIQTVMPKTFNFSPHPCKHTLKKNKTKTKNRALLNSSSHPGTCNVEEAGLQLTEVLLTPHLVLHPALMFINMEKVL